MEIVHTRCCGLDAYQGRGLGRMLLKLLASFAVVRGVECFDATVLGENPPMRSLLRSFGARQVGYDMGAYMYRLQVLFALDEARLAA